MDRLIIIGAGGFARETLDVVEALNAVERRWDFLGFLDDNKSEDPLITRRGARILGTSDLLPELDCEYVIAIADPAARERIDEVATRLGGRPATLIHPAAILGSMNVIGPGLIAMAGASVTTNVTIGRHAHVNPTAAIGHDAVLGAYVTLYPGARISGNVTLGDAVTVGTGACVIQGLTVGRGTFVGAGAVVTGDLQAGLVVVGIPARPLVR
jgi:sugar O-acyltransferase (sialic acid O-acetyltransferase NeuD family)